MFAWQAHEGAVTSLAFGPAGRVLVSAGDDHHVKAWEPFTGAESFRVSLAPAEFVPRGTAPLRFLTLSPDGSHAALYQHGHRLVFLDLASGGRVATWPLPQIAAVKRLPDGEAVLALVVGLTGVGSADVCRYEFAARLGSTFPNLRHWSPASRALAFSLDGRRLAIGRTLHPWPPLPNGRVSAVRMKGYEPEDLAFSADNEHLFALVGGKVAVYSLFTSLFKTKLKGHCGQITAMQLAPDGRRLWTASRDATVKCWDTFSLSLDRTFRFDTGGLDCLAVSPDGNVAAVGGQKGTITVWDLN